MGDTSIEWTSGPKGEPGYTFNPWLGCAKVHAGCTHCYAEKHQAVAMREGGKVEWGEVWQGGQRVVVADSTWKKPFTWARAAAKAGQRQKVFCASLGDVLEVPEMPPFERLTTEVRDRVNRARITLDGARARLWETIRATATLHNDGTPYDDPALGRDALQDAGVCGPWGLDWLLLTKRPENWALIPEDVRPLVWLGTSIANQETVDTLGPKIHQADGFRYRFVSAEPLVGRIRWFDNLLWRTCHVCNGSMSIPVPGGGKPCVACLDHQGFERAIDWVIIGGESGPKARPFDVDWARDIIEQSSRAGVAVFVKQLGSVWAEQHKAMTMKKGKAVPDSKGGDWVNWPEELHVRQWPNAMSLTEELP